MKPNILVLAAIWVLTVGGAFFIGKSIQSSNSNPDSAGKNAATKSSEGARSAGNLSASEARVASARSRLEASPLVKPGTNNLEKLADIMASGDFFERNNALMALIDTLAPDEFQSVVEAFRELGVDDSRRAEYSMLLSAWAKVDPLGALTYTSENTEGRFANNVVLATWAADNPEAAIAWAKDNHNEDGANPWLIGVIRGIAPNDLPKASELLQTLPRSRERGDALGSIVSLLMSRGAESAKDWTDSIQEDYLRSGARAFTAEAIAENSPEDAASWLSELGDSEALRRVAEDITGDWYRDDPEAAKDWVTTLPPENVPQAAEGIVERMVREDSTQTAEYLADLMSNYPDANFDDSIRDLVRHSRTEDPELAAEWVGGMTDEGMQNRMYHWVLGEWNGKDPNTAQDWISRNQRDLPNRVVDRFLPSGE